MKKNPLSNIWQPSSRRTQSCSEVGSQRSLKTKGQSFLELALILPVLILILLGLVEVVFFIGRYLDMIDLTREAARFASVRDPFDNSINRDLDCNTSDGFYFFYDTACLFSPPKNSDICSVCSGEDCKFCNGMNAYFFLDKSVDDIVITIYTVKDRNVISDTHPKAADGFPGAALLPDGKTNYWALSNSDSDASNDNNWKKDCKGNVIRDEPYFTYDRVDSTLLSDLTPNKGFVAVEAYYCYHQALNLPIVSNLFPNPMRIHAYTLMPLPAAQPTNVP